MQYSDIIGIEPFFDSTFNMTEERENYWKQFITNEKFESNLKEIVNAFTSPTSDQHKSIWVQGTYGTGKSHSTSVIKHLLCDDLDDIKDYAEKLSNPQLKAMLLNFRKKERVFPVVLKGTYSIVDTEELKYTVQRAVVQQLEDAGVSMTVKSDFQAVIEMLNDKKFDSFWQIMLTNELYRYASTVEELKELLKNGDVEVLKEINMALKKSNMIKATPDIKQWLTEVMDELRKQNVAQYLVIFWDEFTSLLEITERRSILNCIQDIAELSKAPRKDDKNKYIGVYVFLVTHKNMEAIDSYKDLKEDEKTMAKARFLGLKYDMQDITTYHILSNAIKIKDTTKYDALVEERMQLQSEVAEALKEIVAPMDKPAQTQAIIKRLYPFHPYTAYLATFVSRAIGSVERSIFEFLNDDNRGFKDFIKNDIDSVEYLTADKVWDFFSEAFSEDRTNNFDAIMNKFSMYSTKLKDTDVPELSVFKVILLLNLLNRVTQLDDGEQEKSLVHPSKRNILYVLSGAWTNEEINKALTAIDEKQIILKGPDDVYEVSSSALSLEKIQAEKNKLYNKYEDVSVLLDEYVGYKNDITKIISNTDGFNRAIEFSLIWGNSQAVSMEAKLLKNFKKSYAAKVAIFVFRGETPTYDNKSNRAESALETQKNIIQKLSQKDTMKNIVFVISDVFLGQQRFEGVIDAKARENVARETKLEDPSPYEKKASHWMEKWRTEIIDGSTTIIFRGERVNTTTFKSACNAGLISDVARIFTNGAERIPQVASASTGWKQIYAKKTVEKVCYAVNRKEIESFSGAESAVSHLLKDKSGNWIFDENLNYIGHYDATNPMTVLVKAIDDKIAELRNKTVVNIGVDFKFLTEPPYGYYNNYICMAAVALAFRRFIEKMYLSDQGSLVSATIMRDIINAAFDFWIGGKQDAKLRVRFSTAEEKDLIDLIQSIFGVKGDGISETKWAMRASFEFKYKSPLWALKYIVDKGAEFNSVIDALFSLANATGDSITQEDVSDLLESLKKQKTSIALTLERIKDSTCIYAFVDRCLAKVKIKLDDYSNLFAYLNQNLSDAIVFWREEDVEKQILQWCVLQSKQSAPVVNPTPPEEGFEDSYDDADTDNDNPVDGGQNEDYDNETFAGPGFEPIEITPIAIGKTHATIEAATAMINEKEFGDGEAKQILVKLCKEYPVVCSAVMKLLSEE
ncbi:hypothetical protein [Diplocloster hominis]|uniref:hypothetical protein n=1 Tax=Diplocloster hominis TaxID=3079010 RepID=UPI0031BA475E